VLEERKAEKIQIIDLKGKADFADAMIIASGTSSRHVASLAGYVRDYLKHHGFDRIPIEGLEAGEWVLVDAGNVIVHLFKPEVREHYKLEKMWSV
jgi:ribosome silencing factor RsfS/YbeB/iojap